MGKSICDHMNNRNTPNGTKAGRRMGQFMALIIAAGWLAGCSTQQITKPAEVAPLAGDVQLKQRPPLPLDQRKRLAVLDFEDRTDYGTTDPTGNSYSRIGRSAANVLTTFLFRSGQFDLYEREKMAQLIAENSFKASKPYDVQTAVSVGKMAGVDFVAIGAVTSFGFHSVRSQALFLGSAVKQEAEATVDVRIVEVATGRVVASESGRGVAASNTGEVLGVGTYAGYDERLCGNALRAAISQFVDKLIDQSLLTK